MPMPSLEVKGAGAVPAKGLVATLTVAHADDLSRDILKSDTAGLSIPELDLEATTAFFHH